MKIPKIVSVEWEDACTIDSSPWNDVEESLSYEPRIYNTSGYLLYDGKEGIILTSTYSPDHTGPKEQIPRGMIRSIKTLQKESAK